MFPKRNQTQRRNQQQKIKLDVDLSNIIETRRGRRSTRAQKGKEKLRKMMDLERARDRAGL